MGKHPWEPSRLSHSNAVMDQQNNHGKTFISHMGIVDTILTSRVMGVHIPGQCWFGSQLNIYLLNKILLYQYPLTVVDDSAQYKRYKSCLPAGPTRFWSCRPDSKVAGLGPTGRRKNRTLIATLLRCYARLGRRHCNVTALLAYLQRPYGSLAAMPKRPVSAATSLHLFWACSKLGHFTAIYSAATELCEISQRPSGDMTDFAHRSEVAVLCDWGIKSHHSHLKVENKESISNRLPTFIWDPTI